MATRRGRTQAYATGNKVYGSGRSMPTIGPVDKTGYRERDAKGMIWKNALSRRLGIPGGIGGSNNFGASSQPGQPQATGLPTGVSDSMQRPLNTRTPTGQPNVASTIGGGAMGQGQESGVRAIPTRPLTATPSGQLTAQANSGMNGLPYDPSYEGVRRAIAAKRDAANAGLNQQRTQMDIEANSQKREIDQQAPEILKQLLEGFAGRGMAYSGRYAMDQGEQQNQFAAAKSRIDQMLAGNRSALEAEMAKFEAGLASELSDAEYQYARSLAQNAGNLGISTPQAPPVVGGFDEMPEVPGVQSMPTFDPTPQPQALPYIAPSIAQPAPVPQAPQQSTAAMDPQVLATLNSGALTAPRAENPNQQYRPPTPPSPAETQPMDLASRPGGTRTMASFDPRSRTTLSQGGTVTGGNGYVYKFDPNTGQAVRVR